jgi:hypothetical protein
MELGMIQNIFRDTNHDKYHLRSINRVVNYIFRWIFFKY